MSKLHRFFLSLSVAVFGASSPAFCQLESVDTTLVWDYWYFDCCDSQLGEPYLAQDAEMADFVRQHPALLYLAIGHTALPEFWERELSSAYKRNPARYAYLLSQRRAEYLRASTLSFAADSSIDIVPVPMVWFQPFVPKVDREIDHYLNERFTLEVYSPGRFHGKCAALVEEAVFSYFCQKYGKRGEWPWQKRLQKLDQKTYSPALDAEYEQVARQIRQSRQLLFP